MTTSSEHGPGRPGSSWERLVAALEAAGLDYTTTRGGHHIKAICPAHPDRDPSLYLDYDSAKGLTLVRCRAGCDFSAVMAELGVPKPAIHDDYLELEEYKELKAAERAGGSDQTARARAARKTSAKSSAPAAKPLGPLPARLLDRKSRPVSDEVLVCYYDYSSAAGELIQRVNRFEYDAAYPQPDGTEVIRRTKTFRQAFPRPTEGWYERTPAGFVPQLYHLPELQERDEEWTWLPEGEKDVERLKEEDQRGTTNVGGADNFKAKKAVGGYVAALAGHRVIIAVDRDLAGYKRAVEVYDLLAPVAAELRIVLPRVEEPHADVSDHLDAGYSLDDLIVVPIEVMRDLYAAAQMASDIAKGAEECQWAAAEAKARAALAAAGQDPEENWAAAARWAAECGKQLDRVVGKRAALSSLPRSAEFCDTADAGVEEARSATRLRTRQPAAMCPRRPRRGSATTRRTMSSTCSVTAGPITSSTTRSPPARRASGPTSKTPGIGVCTSAPGRSPPCRTSTLGSGAATAPVARLGSTTWSPRSGTASRCASATTKSGRTRGPTCWG
jgi:hypothetical protein